jgi:AraC-like DNA-binding protein
MKQSVIKEVSPIYYGENPVKILLYREKFAGRTCFYEHYHDRMELLRIHSGRMSVQINGISYEALAGDLIIINPNQAHTGKVITDDLTYDVIMFDLINLSNNSFAYHKFLSPIIKQQVSFFNKTDDPMILSMVDSLVRSYTERQTVHPLHTIGMIYSILGAFYQHCQITEHTQNKHAGFNAITAYVDTHFTEPLSNKSLSAQFGYNEAYFSRMFKKNTGVCLSQHIQALRLDLAQKLLRDTNESIAAIAIRCGFSDVFYFSNRFKRYCEKTPREFRALYRRSDT